MTRQTSISFMVLLASGGAVALGGVGDPSPWLVFNGEPNILSDVGRKMLGVQDLDYDSAGLL